MGRIKIHNSGIGYIRILASDGKSVTMACIQGFSLKFPGQMVLGERFTFQGVAIKHPDLPGVTGQEARNQILRPGQGCQPTE
ncbi:MAG: hypothetical protein V1793_07780 [Pseudomonadota bacterium]